MENRCAGRKDTMNLKKMRASGLLLLICLILLVSASYAWLTMSLAPEITGMDTNIGSNGSLEIALLSSDTYVDPAGIRSRAGDSVVREDRAVSNLSWGNMVDLSDESYGLSEIYMKPARLNLSPDSEGGYFVKSNMLMIPHYGADGRILQFNIDGESGGYQNGGFQYNTDQQYYGVRGIGTISNLHAQQVALTGARTAIKAHTTAAYRMVAIAWASYGEALTGILSDRYAQGSDQVSGEDLEKTAAMAERISDAYGYVDSALRQSLVGYAASAVGDEETFKSIRSTVENRSIPLSQLLQGVSLEIPEQFRSWAEETDRVAAHLDALARNARQLAQQTQTIPWPDAEPLIASLIDVNGSYAQEDLLSSGEAYPHFTNGDTSLILSANAGALGTIANFIGNYTVYYTISISGSPKPGNVEVQTASASAPCLAALAYDLDNRQPAYTVGARVTLRDICGYAVDTAFRCNVTSDLLLQTEESLRVAENTEFPVTQGGGSYMRFRVENLQIDRTLFMMDGIRVGFLDSQGTLMAIAKLNTSNYQQTGDTITAPLYLYEYTVEDSGGITMGERREEGSSITELAKNVPTIVTIVVWLDGDHVDNSMASATDQKMEGMLNLQFASSADLLLSEQIIRES